MVFLKPVTYVCNNLKSAACWTAKYVYFSFTDTHTNNSEHLHDVY